MALDKQAGSQILNKGTVNPWGSQEIKMSQGLVAVTARLS
jgi:hypothetical protein